MVELRHKVLGTVGAPIEKQEDVEPIAPADLQSLIELGCIKEEVKVGTFVFVLRSLSASERMSLAKEFNQEMSDQELFTFNLKLLSMAIESVNGQPLESLHPNPDGDELSTKMDLVAALQTPVITKLIDTYTKIMERCDKQFGMEQVKN